MFGAGVGGQGGGGSYMSSNRPSALSLKESPPHP